MSFNYESFEKLLKEIKDQNRYTFLRFDQEITEDKERLIYLRHDIDISPYSANQLGKIEHSINIKANYFFQIGAETYNIFNKSVIDIMKELYSIGHCVGLHVDESILGDSENKLLSTLKWFKECITDVNFVVSFHRPTNTNNKKFKSFINVYQDDFFSPDLFLSDSRKNEDFYPKLLNLLKEGKSPIQLLLHPAWWYPEEDLAQFKELVVKRRVAELNSYLKKNFQNIKRYIKDEDSNFGL
ncbi:MAG: hypothetical protein HWN65_13440 [Candidatus Helarchaeota archaeon]|nr:hypothetical protein [Candidatus Helarchaeota archaeon]